MHPIQLITDFARHVGVGASVGPEGVLSLLFDGKHSVTLEPLGQRGAILIFAVLGRMPPKGPARTAMAEALLELNLFGAGSGLGAFALDPLEEEILLNRLLPTDPCDVAMIEAAVEDFVSRLEGAAEAIQSALAQQQSGLPQTMEDLATGDRMWLRG